MVGSWIDHPPEFLWFQNFFPEPASNPMSSLSGAQFDADDRTRGATVTDPAQVGTPGSSPSSAAMDTDLLRRARSGDRSAFGQLAMLYQDRLFNGVLRVVGDRETARDVVQETFTRGFSKLDGFRGDSGAYTWLFRIAMNLAITELRREQRHSTFSLDGTTSSGLQDGRAAPLARLTDTSETAPDTALRKERASVVLAALGRLDVEYRVVLVMRDIEDFDYQQMADVLGLPLGTLKSRLFRARLALRDELKEFMKND